VAKTIGEAARFFLTRYRVNTLVGPYVITTTEVRPGRFETTVTWGEGGPEVEHFGSDPTFARSAAAVRHEETCEHVEASAGLAPAPALSPPAA
jgi:hypothetical protein